MPFRNGYSPPSVWYNAVQHRYTGVVGYDPVSHAKGNGPLGVSVGSSGTSIVLDIKTGNVRIRREEYSAPGGPQTLASNATEADPRRDVIYVAEGGSISVASEAPGDDAIYPYDPDANNGEGGHTTQRPRGPQAPLPEGPHMAGLARCALATIKVPAGASDSNDITNADIHDIRRPAIKPRREPWQDPTPLGSGGMSPGDTRRWGTMVPPGHTISLYSLGQSVYRSDFSNYDLTLTFRRVDGPDDWSTPYDMDGQYAQGDPLASDSVAASATDPVHFVISQHYSGDANEDISENFPATATASLTVDPTDEVF